MERKNTILDFFNHTFIIFGITICFLIVFVALFGEGAVEVSSVFQLKDSGIALTTLLQYLLMSIIVTTLRMVFFTDIFIKNASLVIRTIALFIFIIPIIAILASTFGWFPVHMWQAWLAFFLCFIVCATISIAISAIKEKRENEKLQAALENFCKGDSSCAEELK